MRAACSQSPVELEVQLGHDAGREGAGDARRGGSRRRSRVPSAAGLVRLVAGNADHDAGMREIVGHQHPGDRHEADPRVADIAREGVGDDLAHRFRHLFGPPEEPFI